MSEPIDPVSFVASFETSTNAKGEEEETEAQKQSMTTNPDPRHHDVDVDDDGHHQHQHHYSVGAPSTGTATASATLQAFMEDAQSFIDSLHYIQIGEEEHSRGDHHHHNNNNRDHSGSEGHVTAVNTSGFGPLSSPHHSSSLLVANYLPSSVVLVPLPVVPPEGPSHNAFTFSSDEEETGADMDGDKDKSMNNNHNTNPHHHPHTEALEDEDPVEADERLLRTTIESRHNSQSHTPSSPSTPETEEASSAVLSAVIVGNAMMQPADGSSTCTSTTTTATTTTTPTAASPPPPPSRRRGPPSPAHVTCSVAYGRVRDHLQERNITLCRQLLQQYTSSSAVFRGGTTGTGMKEWKALGRQLLGLECFHYKREDYDEFPSLSCHISPSDLRCYRAGLNAVEVRRGDAEVGRVLWDKYLRWDYLMPLCLRILGDLIQDRSVAYGVPAFTSSAQRTIREVERRADEPLPKSKHSSSSPHDFLPSTTTSPSLSRKAAMKRRRDDLPGSPQNSNTQTRTNTTNNHHHHHHNSFHHPLYALPPPAGGGGPPAAGHQRGFEESKTVMDALTFTHTTRRHDPQPASGNRPPRHPPHGHLSEEIPMIPATLPFWDAPASEPVSRQQLLLQHLAAPSATTTTTMDPLSSSPSTASALTTSLTTDGSPRPIATGNRGGVVDRMGNDTHDPDKKKEKANGDGDDGVGGGTAHETARMIGAPRAATSSEGTGMRMMNSGPEGERIMKHRRLDDVVSPSASMPDVVAPTTTTPTTTTTTTTTANQHTYPEKGNLKIFHLTKEIVGLVLEANPIFVSLPRSMIQSVLHSVLVYCLSHPCPLGVNGGPDGAVSAPLLREPTFIEMDQRLHHLSSHPGKIKVKRFQRIVLPLPSCSSRDVKASLGGVGGQVDRVGAPHSTSSNPTAASIIPQNYPQMTMPTTTTNNNNMMMSMVIVPTTTTDYPVWYSSHTLLPPQPSYLPHAAATTVLYGNSSSVPPLSTVVIPQPQPQPRPPFSALPSSVVCPSLAAPMMTMGSRREPAAVERERGVLYPAGRVCWEIEGYGRLTCPRLVEAIVTMNKTHDSRSLRVGDMGRLHVWWWWYVRNASPPSFFSS